MAKKKAKRKALKAVLLAELRGIDKPVFHVSKETGISHPVLYHFLNGNRQELRLSTIDKLLKYFEVELKTKRRK